MLSSLDNFNKNNDLKLNTRHTAVEANSTKPKPNEFSVSLSRIITILLGLAPTDSIEFLTSSSVVSKSNDLNNKILQGALPISLVPSFLLTPFLRLSLAWAEAEKSIFWVKFDPGKFIKGNLGLTKETAWATDVNWAKP